MGKSMTIDQIKNELSKKLETATENTYREGVEIIKISFDVFYHGKGYPKKYKRTNTLPNSEYSEKQITKTSSYIELGYDGDQISYNTGSFSGSEVLGATMTGTYGVVGDPEYDDMAFEDIAKAMKKYFDAEFK